jgi:CxxC motif-containing protein (DUF1111 family)
MLFNPRPVPARPAADVADPPARDVQSLGRELFARKWLPDDPRCHGGDGLGPVYNATSCLDCHNLGGPGGAGPADQNVELATGIGYISSPGGPEGIQGDLVASNVGLDLFPTRSLQADLVRTHPGFRDGLSTVFHRFGVDPDYSRWRATFCSQSRPAPPSPGVSSGLSRRRHAMVHSRSRDQGPVVLPIPAEELTALCKDAADLLGMTRVAVALTARNTPPLFGAGRIDELEDSELERVARHQPPETRGRVHRLKDGRIGRFGRKAQVASLEDFVLTACANELGLEVPGHHQAASPLAPDAKARGLDLTRDECDALVAYVRDLPPPVSLAPSGGQGSATVTEGRGLFQSIGCATCHIPDLGAIQGLYSDLLLHDTGEALSDPGDYYAEDSDSPGAPKRGESRTPPLWGFRDSGPYLHDGRAQDLEREVALHGGQGAASAYRFRSLPRAQQSRVQAFLDSLVTPDPADSPWPIGAVDGPSPRGPSDGRISLDIDDDPDGDARPCDRRICSTTSTDARSGGSDSC